MKKLIATTAAALALTAGAAMSETQGVTDTEVVLGSASDLSGIFAAFGAPAMKASQMYFDEINEKGGIHGRKIRLVVEDHGYQVPKAVQAANKLINRDKVFAMYMSLGTPHNIAAFPLQEAKNIPNLLPLTSARQMLQDPLRLKFAGYSSYYDGTRAAVRYLANENGRKNFCAMYIPSDFGKEIYHAVADEAKAAGSELMAETTHKPDEVDFVGSLTKLKDAGCDLVGMALSVRGTITAVATAKKIGWTDVDFVGSSASFHTAIAEVPGGVTDGFYAGSGWVDLRSVADRPETAKWIEKYTKSTGEAFPGTGALLGRTSAEMVARALEAAGPDLTTDSFIAAMEGLQYEDPITGGTVNVGENHTGGSLVYISQVENGAWKLMGTEDTE